MSFNNSSRMGKLSKKPSQLQRQREERGAREVQLPVESGRGRTCPAIKPTSGWRDFFATDESEHRRLSASTFARIDVFTNIVKVDVGEKIPTTTSSDSSNCLSSSKKIWSNLCVVSKLNCSFSILTCKIKLQFFYSYLRKIKFVPI